MRARVVFVTNLLLGVGLLAFVLTRNGWPALGILETGYSAPLLVGFLALVPITIASLAWRWGWILGGICSPPPLYRLCLIRSAGHALAILIPSGKIGGDPLRAWLVTRERVPVGAAISSVVVDRALELASTSPFSMAFAALLLQHGIPQLERAMVTISAATIGLVAGCVIAARRLRRGVGLMAPLVHAARLDRLRVVDDRMDVLGESDSAAAEIVGNSQRLLVALAAGFVSNALVIAEFALLLAAFGLPNDPVAVVAAIFATGAAHMLPIPAGIGVLEGANLWLFQMLGYPADVGLAVGIAARLRELVWIAPGLALGIDRSIRSSLAESKPS